MDPIIANPPPERRPIRRSAQDARRRINEWERNRDPNVTEDDFGEVHSDEDDDDYEPSEEEDSESSDLSDDESDDAD